MSPETKKAVSSLQTARAPHGSSGIARETNRLPPAPRCETCLFGSGTDAITTACKRRAVGEGTCTKKAASERAIHSEHNVRGPWQCQTFACGCGCPLLCSANVLWQTLSGPGRMPALSQEPSKYEARHALRNPILRLRRMPPREVGTHCTSVRAPLRYLATSSTSDSESRAVRNLFNLQWCCIFVSCGSTSKPIAPSTRLPKSPTVSFHAQQTRNAAPRSQNVLVLLGYQSSNDDCASVQ